jgi:hypothetical protein
MPRLLQLTLVAAAAGAHAHVHGTFTRQNTLQILRRTRPWGGFSAHLLSKQSTCASVKVACHALEFKDAYSIVQLRDDGDASMFVCRIRSSEEHEIVSILSTGILTPLRAVERVVAWHDALYEGKSRLSVCPGIFTHDVDLGGF